MFYVCDIEVIDRVLNRAPLIINMKYHKVALCQFNIKLCLSGLLWNLMTPRHPGSGYVFFNFSWKLKYSPTVSHLLRNTKI